MKNSPDTSESGEDSSSSRDSRGLPDIVSIVMGPICETFGVNVIRSLTKALDRVIVSGTEYLIADWEVKKRDKFARQEARETILRRVAETAADTAANTPAIVESGLIRWADDLIRGQENTLDIVLQAKEQLTLNPPEKDAEKEIDDTWLNHFYELAKHKSSPLAQAMFARVMAEEIKKPGSFSIKTLRVLAEMPDKTGEAFKILCNPSIADDDLAYVISEPYGQPGNNALTDFGLSFISFSYLIDSDLIIGDLNTHSPLGVFINKTLTYTDVPIVIAKHKEYNEEIKPQTKTKVIIFSVVGFELKKIMTPKIDQKYTEGLFDWFESKGLIINRVIRQQGDQVYGEPLIKR